MTRQRWILTAAVLLSFGLSGCAAPATAPVVPVPSADALQPAQTPQPSEAPAATATPSAAPTLVDPADFAPVDFGTGVVFTSPSRNLACGILTLDNDPGNAVWGCAIDDKQWEFPTAQPEDYCFDAQVPCGHGIEAVGSEQPHPRKRGDVAFESEYSESTVALPVGSAIAYGDVICASTDAGISCAHTQSGHGFTLSETANEIW
ncbi:hypothetical protein [Microterricola viridarii]|uniref:Uncharacterized protein n=1 Tax=Microterricola viridarii TaxID=412690 RepID=A0A1H1RSV1_9MICO|nr:hypothetical protein [Microterricola viridarii]SDS38770.1 hypothetical protein SAMN04489834_1389 [Microterricola viridarii]